MPAGGVLSPNEKQRPGSDVGWNFASAFAKQPALFLVLCQLVARDARLEWERTSFRCLPQEETHKPGAPRELGAFLDVHVQSHPWPAILAADFAGLLRD